MDPCELPCAPEHNFVAERIAFAAPGSHGQLSGHGDAVSLGQFDDDSYFIAFTQFDLSHGFASRKLHLYVASSQGVQNVLYLPLDADNEGAVARDDTEQYIGWSTTWAFVAVPGGRPDIVAIKTGIEQGQAIDAVVRYRMRGGQFVPFQIADAEREFMGSGLEY